MAHVCSSVSYNKSVPLWWTKSLGRGEDEHNFLCAEHYIVQATGRCGIIITK